LDILSLLLQLVAGAFGGNIAGASMPKFSLGVRGNALAGLVGGALGGTVFAALLGAHSHGTTMDPDFGALFAQIVGGGAGGAAGAALIGLLQRALGRA
jgi:uncharacterized membrane protein YeaQ/YmgE (transglycosylase-associated protein family)